MATTKITHFVGGKDSGCGSCDKHTKPFTLPLMSSFRQERCERQIFTRHMKLKERNRTEMHTEEQSRYCVMFGRTDKVIIP